MSDIRFLTEEEQLAKLGERTLLTSEHVKRINQLVTIHKASITSFEMILRVAEFASACSMHGLDSIAIENAVEEMYPHLATSIQTTLEDMRQDNE